MCEKEKELVNLDDNINKTINTKCELMRLCFEKYENNKNPNAKEFIDWVRQHPDETAETYHQKYDELVIEDWIFE